GEEGFGNTVTHSSHVSQNRLDMGHPFIFFRIPQSPFHLIRSRNLRPWLGGIFPALPESSSYNGLASGAGGRARGRLVRRTKSGTEPAIPGLARSRAFAIRTAAVAASSTDASPPRRPRRQIAE